MKLFSNIKARVKSARLKTKAIAGGFILATASIAAAATLSTAAASPVSTPNCDNNAVVYCGASNVSTLQSKYTNGDSHNKAYTIQDIYHAFNIGPSDVSAMSGYTVSGYVTKSGDVYAGNTLVATNAVTAGRQYIKGSTTVKYGATTFYKRTPSVSFLDSELSAMVVMKNGVFQYAILNSCGNPVNATPKKPNYSIKKLVNGSSNVTVKSGSSVNYSVQVASTGQIAADNILVRDALPASSLNVDKSSLKENGKAVSSTVISQFFGSGYKIPSLAVGSTDTFTFTATAGSADYTALSCAAEKINNTAYISSTGLPNESSTATVNTTCETPELACDSLKPAVIGKADQLTGDQSYSFTATASATRETIANYTFDFGDNSANDVVTTSATSATSATHTFTPGDHTVSVTVNGKTATGGATSATCKYSFSVAKPAPGTLACTDLKSVEGTTSATTGETSYTFTTTGTASANAQITGYTYSVNGAAAVNGGATYTTSFAPGKSYTVQATVTGTDLTTGKTITATSNNCEVTVTPPHPAYSIVKQVSKSQDSGYTSDLTGIPTGSTVYYKIVVTNTGDITVQNVNVADQAASDIHYNAGTLQENGASADATLFFGKGIEIASIDAGKTVTFTFSATVGNTTTDTDPSCTAETLNNTGAMTTTTPGLSGQSSSAKVATTCRELQGALTCTALNAIGGDIDQTTGSESYTFKGTATATNAKITGYSFVITNTTTGATVTTLPGTLSSDTNSATTASYSLAPGSYKIVLTVTGTDLYGKALTAPANENCATTVSPTQPTCQMGQVGTYPNCTTPTCQEGQTGTYPNCVTPTCQPGQMGTYPNCTTPTCENGQMGTYPNCTTPTTPSVLPNTGAGDTIGIFIGTVVAGTVAFRIFLSRKLRSNQE